jgi:multidrug efflux pump subunit AcrA (membrane-fusion protein)
MFSRPLCGRKTNNLLIPASAVVRRSECGGGLCGRRQGQAKLRQVRLGEASGENEIEVLVGLKPGENVALDPIKAGMAVARP